jgi:hypothetical protein
VLAWCLLGGLRATRQAGLGHGSGDKRRQLRVRELVGLVLILGLGLWLLSSSWHASSHYSTFLSPFLSPFLSLFLSLSISLSFQLPSWSGSGGGRQRAARRDLGQAEKGRRRGENLRWAMHRVGKDDVGRQGAEGNER